MTTLLEIPHVIFSVHTKPNSPSNVVLFGSAEDATEPRFSAFLKEAKERVKAHAAAGGGLMATLPIGTWLLEQGQIRGFIGKHFVADRREGGITSVWAVVQRPSDLTKPAIIDAITELLTTGKLETQRQ